VDVDARTFSSFSTLKSARSVIFAQRPRGACCSRSIKETLPRSDRAPTLRIVDLDSYLASLRAELQSVQGAQALSAEHEPDWAAAEAKAQAFTDPVQRATWESLITMQRAIYVWGQRVYMLHERSVFTITSLLQLGEAIAELRERVEALENG